MKNKRGQIYELEVGRKREVDSLKAPQKAHTRSPSSIPSLGGLKATDGHVDGQAEAAD